MATHSKVISLLQREISKQEEGILFSVEIINISELSILLDDLDRIFTKFYSIVEKACLKADEHKILSASEAGRLYIIVPDNAKNAEKLAYSIYSQVQLYVDDQVPESYLQCSVGSIKFSKAQNLTAYDILARLSYGMQHSEEQGYYYCYDDNPLDVDVLRSDNIKLNLLRAALLNKKAKFVYQPVIDRKTGKMTQEECEYAESCMSRSIGHCMTMGTASTMAVMVESLGLTLSGASAIPAADSRKRVLAQLSGRRIVDMVKEDLTIDKVLTKEAFENAIKVNAAVGGSSNFIIHMMAIAGRIGVELNLEDFDTIGSKIPLLLNLMPSGKYLMEDFYYAGGLPVVLDQLANELHKNVITVTGKNHVLQSSILETDGC